MSVYIDSEQAWYRGKVEQVGQGPDKTQVKVRSTDFGWCRFVKVDSLRQLPAALASLPVRCEKYKMAYIQPRGRDHGYSAADRLAGAEWLKQLIDRSAASNSALDIPLASPTKSISTISRIW